ncbi:MAG: phosphoglycerate kinase [Candidatus Binatia bacterium]|nr:MAG: phosphoglycerate kinase [Candidatus Binatia bacterium]
MKTIEEISLPGRRVFLRADFNVPLSGGEVADTWRIEATLPTVRYALERGARLVLASHLGRPKGRRSDEFSLAPVARCLSGMLATEVPLAPDCVGEEVERLVEALEPGRALLLENLRFHPGEEANDESFGRALARLAEIYVNDAFGAAHRAHASTVGMVRFVAEKAAGFLLARECHYLGKILAEPERPFVALLGGAKVSDKIGVLEALVDKVDVLLVGGAMAYTFLVAQGVPVGDSRVEEDRVETAGGLLERARKKGTKLLLPVDHRVSASTKGDKPVQTVTQSIPEGMVGVDIGPRTEELFREEIEKARTVFWNGPMGIFEVERFGAGTVAMARALAECSAVTVVGGGDSAAAVRKAGVADKITHISTGGGAALEFLEGKPLPGLLALEDTP